MNDPRIAKLAKVLTEYSAPVREGVQVMIQGTPLAQPLVLALYREVLRRGGHPLIVLEVPGAEEIFFQE
ncbi:MAG: aminopeptidase, partial [Anaerolineae bacterium]|nr:aminopeptidase [Anaerolineae bacterium]